MDNVYKYYMSFFPSEYSYAVINDYVRIGRSTSFDGFITSINHLATIQLCCTKTGGLIHKIGEIFPSGAIVLNHYGHQTHFIRKWMNRFIPKQIRVIIRDGKFYLLDEHGQRHLFDKAIVIEWGKVRYL